MSLLLFVDGPGYHSPRSLGAAWDLGHILVFSLWSSLLLAWRPVRNSHAARQWGWVLLFCVAAGGVTEWIQSLMGRDPSFGDLLRDVLGGVLTLSWSSPSGETLSGGGRRIVKGVSASFLLAACLPLAAGLIDEGIARSQFPLLSDFETPLERTRWRGDAYATVDRRVARRGKASLRVDMDTSLDSGVALVHFPRNWKAYRLLNLEVLNPSPEGLTLNCRIHDRRHEDGDQRYEDRFNRSFHLRPGWNGLRIELDEVARAPVGRTMDLGETRVVGLFATRLPAPRTIYVDHVRLE